MRKLEFGTEDQDREVFQMLYTGFLLGTPEGGIRGLAKNRVAMKIMDKFESIAKEEKDYKDGDRRPMAPTGDPILELNGGGSIVLESAEYEMLKGHVENAPWLPAAARRVVRALTFLEEAPEE